MRGALRVSSSLPCLVGRWPSSAFGNLGARNTSRFRGPLCVQRSVRLFLRDGLITNEQALSYDHGRIAVGIPAHLAVRAPHQRRSGYILRLVVLRCSAPQDVDNEHTADWYSW